MPDRKITQTAICNAALSHMGKGFINTIDEASEPARQCKLLWDMTVKSVLRDFPWNFATRYKKLAKVLLTEVPPGWLYAYEHPVGALLIRKLCTEHTLRVTKPVEFEIIDDPTQGTVILSNLDGAYCKYTTEINDPTKFESSFIDALTWRLAADLAVPLTGNQKLREHLLAIYDRQLVSARQSNAQESREPQIEDTSYLDSRG